MLIAEVEGAQLASRFNRSSSVRDITSRMGTLAPAARAAVALEGEVGYKREALLRSLREAQHVLVTTVGRVRETIIDFELSKEEG